MLKMLLIIHSDLVVSSTALAQGLNTSPTEVDHAIPTDSSLPLTATSRRVKRLNPRFWEEAMRWMQPKNKTQ